MGIFNLFARASCKQLPIKFYIGLGGAVAGLALMIFNLIFLYPHIDGLIEADQYSIDQLAEVARQVQAFQDRHPKLAEYRTTMAKRQDRYRNLLPDEAEVAAFLGEVEEYAAQNRLELLGVKPTAPRQTDQKPEELLVELELRGDYSALLAFMRDLQQARRYNRLNRLLLKNTSRGIECRLSLMVFSFSPNKTLTKVADNLVP